ncbi:rRNA maturation RNase YbeY [Parvibaculum sedimenti]|uniref:Endoribonuclease YbeY n=1 Tax=Parvibaculum sedimenti TaxID=2608632 RepID=A0A6N6VLW6_9HYPH|nr:rRNA maturation RNase YbeY [Parvibaculum sedimenti]KAB7742599.1 rRNA maturation RNase YbeY [Parvibaculum sedimenti]
MSPSRQSKTLEDQSPVSGLEIDILREAGNWAADAEELVRRAAEHAYVVAGPAEEAELCVVLADDPFVQALNKTWRGKDKPTNVLSFPTGDMPQAEPVQTQLLGDVVLALETIEREAKEQGKTFPDHLSHLVVHGVLHLLGHDHEVDAEAEEMEALERDILEDLDITDPYSPSDGSDDSRKRSPRGPDV